ncbi:hypothetical protein FRC00_006841 [Tulasnella sp. 408]|nr:hypothetical protein FRC00_006841 [Tulasnella sp. 408]
MSNSSSVSTQKSSSTPSAWANGPPPLQQPSATSLPRSAASTTSAPSAHSRKSGILSQAVSVKDSVSTPRDIALSSSARYSTIKFGTIDANGSSSPSATTSTTVAASSLISIYAITPPSISDGLAVQPQSEILCSIPTQTNAAPPDPTEQTAKRQGLGLVRFIGELFKLQMLTERIMHECIKKLLSKIDDPEEEEIESVCKLMTTVGDALDTPRAKGHMDIYFGRMQIWADNQNVASRVRYMLLNVIELRQRSWRPRRATANPSTIARVGLATENSIAAHLQPESPASVPSRVHFTNASSAATPSSAPSNASNAATSYTARPKRILDANKFFQTPTPSTPRAPPTSTSAAPSTITPEQMPVQESSQKLSPPQQTQTGWPQSPHDDWRPQYPQYPYMNSEWYPHMQHPHMTHQHLPMALSPDFPLLKKKEHLQ